VTPPLRDPRAGENWSHAPAKIALVGLRGSGKSTVGALLANELQRPFADLDHELERAQQSSHPADPPLRAGEILARLGEPAFRELESRALLELLGRPGPLVLACGGGVVLREENRARLREVAWVVWLDAPDEELARRLAADPTPRPPLTHEGQRAGAASLQEIAALRAQRQRLYEEVAQLRIRTEGVLPPQVASLLRGGLGLPQA
jgi:shikimate kinase